VSRTVARTCQGVDEQLFVEALETRLLLSASQELVGVIGHPDLLAEPLGFDQDTSMYFVPCPADVPQGEPSVLGVTPAAGDESYMLIDNWGGAWHDAEKSPSNTEDDVMCWAAAASNILAWGGWGQVDGMTTADEMFAYFQDHWTDAEGLAQIAWDWWFDGTSKTQGWAGWSQVDVAGGGFYPGEDIYDYLQWSSTLSQAMGAVDAFMHAGYGIALALYGAGEHAVTAWGYTYEAGSPTSYTGIYISDSDDDKSAEDAPDSLQYYQVLYTGNRWYLQDFYGSDGWFIGEVDGLKANPGGVPPSNQPPVIDDQSFAVDENAADGTEAASVAASDPDVGDTLTYAITGGNTDGAFTIDGATGQITVSNSVALNYEVNPIFDLSVEVTDTEGLTDTATVTIGLNDVQEPPVAGDDVYETDQGNTLVVPAAGVLGNDQDPDGDPLATTLIAGPANGSLTLNADGSFEYTPNGGFSGADTFTYVANDGAEDSNEATVTITVADVGGYTFDSREDVDAGNGPRSMVSADFNADGHPDLAVVNTLDNDVTVLYGQAGGGFGGRVDYTVGGGPRGIVAADFNGDGRLDLAVANFADNDVSLLWGLSGGAFGSRQDYGVGASPIGIVTGDFNSDGRLDLATANYSGNTVSVLYKHAVGGYFTGRRDFGVGSRPYDVVTDDFNGDGRLDLAVTNFYDNDVSLLWGLVGGRFGSRQDYAVGSGPLDIVAGDFNRDGRPDVAVSCYRDNTVVILHKLAIGGYFGDRQNTAVGNLPVGLVAEDVNDDGYLDLAVTNYADNDVSVLWGLAGGDVGNREDYDVGARPLAIVSADFNGSYMDLAVANLVDGSVGVLFGGEAAGVGATTSDEVGGYPLNTATTAVHSDDDLDHAAVNTSDKTVAALYSQPGAVSGSDKMDGPRASGAGQVAVTPHVRATADTVAAASDAYALMASQTAGNTFMATRVGRIAPVNTVVRTGAGIERTPESTPSLSSGARTPRHIQQALSRIGSIRTLRCASKDPFRAPDGAFPDNDRDVVHTESARIPDSRLRTSADTVADDIRGA